jgi:NTP pyrophosphatase (non-canonical NTP hydrolase)
MNQFVVHTLNEYQRLAQRTANKKLDFKSRLAAAGLGAVGEAGEIAEHIKKHIAHGHELDREKLIKEIGDELWYLAELASLLDVDLATIATKNIEKLKKRYPDGFSEERSINRIE